MREGKDSQAIERRTIWDPAWWIVLITLGLVLPSLSIGLLSDDFSWLRIVRDTAGSSCTQYLALPSPYGYFRPLPMAIFRFIGLSLPGQVWPFRVLTLLFHISNCLLLYKSIKLLDFHPRAALCTALLFAVLPCHAEALFWISSLNEPLSSFLLLLGFYLLISQPLMLSAPFSTLFFIAALATRESSFCYFPLLLLLALRRPKLRSPLVIPVLLLPGAIFLVSRLWWLSNLPSGLAVSSPGELSLNPLDIARRLVHYLVAMAIPAKSLFAVIGFEKFEALRRWLASPSAFPAFYWSMAIASLAALLALACILFKQSGRALVGPLVFIALALAVYIPFRNTSEHFLYFPSIGFCLATGTLLHGLSSKNFGAALALMISILTLYAASRAERMYRWHQASAQVERSLDQLSAVTSDLPDGSKVLVEGLDNRYFGIPFLGEHSLQDAWDLRHPRRSLGFYFDRTGRDSSVVKYSPGSFSFRRAD